MKFGILLAEVFFTTIDMFLRTRIYEKPYMYRYCNLVTFRSFRTDFVAKRRKVAIAKQYS